MLFHLHISLGRLSLLKSHAHNWQIAGCETVANNYKSVFRACQWLQVVGIAADTIKQPKSNKCF